MFSSHAILKRHSIAILIFALMALPYHTVRACCCLNPTAQSKCACDGCCCQMSDQQSSSNDDCSDPSCETCRKDCKCQKQIEQNKVVRTLEKLVADSPVSINWVPPSLQPVNSSAVTVVADLDLAWLDSTYNQRRALSSVWLK